MCDNIYRLLQALDIFDEPLTINLGDSHNGWGTKQLHELNMDDDNRATLDKLHRHHSKKCNHDHHGGSS